MIIWGSFLGDFTLGLGLCTWCIQLYLADSVQVYTVDRLGNRMIGPPLFLRNPTGLREENRNRKLNSSRKKYFVNFLCFGKVLDIKSSSIECALRITPSDMGVSFMNDLTFCSRKGHD
jgi:hypothetical protein